MEKGRQILQAESVGRVFDSIAVFEHGPVFCEELTKIGVCLKTKPGKNDTNG
jgi:hypothetical protein